MAKPLDSYAARLLVKRHAALWGDKAYEPARWIVDALIEASGGQPESVPTSGPFKFFLARPDIFNPGRGALSICEELQIERESLITSELLDRLCQTSLRQDDVILRMDSTAADPGTTSTPIALYRHDAWLVLHVLEDQLQKVYSSGRLPGRKTIEEAIEAIKKAPR